jgi:hypothetical protein
VVRADSCAAKAWKNRSAVAAAAASMSRAPICASLPPICAVAL